MDRKEPADLAEMGVLREMIRAVPDFSLRVKRGQ